MKIEGSAKRLCVYIGENRQWHGTALYHAIVLKARELGLAGATAMRGVEGFGTNSHIRAAHLLDLSTDLPMVIEIVDRADRIAKILPFLEETLREGLVTLEDVNVIRHVFSVHDEHMR